MPFDPIDHAKEAAGVVPACPVCQRTDQWVPCSFPAAETFAKATDGGVARLDTHGLLCTKCGGIILVAAPLDDVAGV